MCVAPLIFPTYNICLYWNNSKRSKKCTIPLLDKNPFLRHLLLTQNLKKCISNCLWEHKQMYKFYNYYLQSSLDNLKKNVYKANVCSNYENRLTTG